MMPRTRIRASLFCAAVLALVCAGCATAPRDTVAQVAPDTFHIHYSPSRFGSKMTPEDRVLLVAARTTLGHNYKYFALVGIGDDAASRTPAKPAPAAAPESVYGIYGFGGGPQPAGSQITAASKGITIKCFALPPADLIASNAAAVESDIKKKYLIP